MSDLFPTNLLQKPNIVIKCESCKIEENFYRQFLEVHQDKKMYDLVAFYKCPKCKKITSVWIHDTEKIECDYKK